MLLGGLFPTPRGDITMESFLDEVYRHGGGRLFDAAAVHPYAANPQRALASTAELRSLMDRNDDADKPIWITEVGWASRGTPPGLVVGLQGQANYLKQTFELATADRDRLKIAGVDLVLALGYSGPALGRPLRAVHGRRHSEAGLGGVRECGWRNQLEARLTMKTPTLSKGAP